MVTLLRDPQRACEMGGAGRARVLREQLTWERVAERMTTHLRAAAVRA